MGPMRLYRASDALMAYREAIEHHLFDQAMGLFDLRPTITLYDLIHLLRSARRAQNPSARRRHSKASLSGLVKPRWFDPQQHLAPLAGLAGNVRAPTLEMLDALRPRAPLVGWTWNRHRAPRPARAR